MSLKYSSTTADYLVWSDAMNLIRKLAKDGNYKISLLIALGCFTGLRISDILALRWKQILNTSEFTVTLNPQLHSRSATYIKRNGLLIRKITIKSSRPFQCAYHPLTP